MSQVVAVGEGPDEKKIIANFFRPPFRPQQIQNPILPQKNNPIENLINSIFTEKFVCFFIYVFLNFILFKGSLFASAPQVFVNSPSIGFVPIS